MSASNPQFLYIILVLPGLFGLALLGEGINKVVREELSGVISIIFGLLFIAVVAFIYSYSGNYLAVRIPMY